MNEEKLYRVIFPIRFAHYKYNCLNVEGMLVKTDYLSLVPQLTVSDICRIDRRLMVLAEEVRNA